MKALLILSSVALAASMQAQGLRILSTGTGTAGYDEDQLMGMALSPDGRYVCGATNRGDGFFVADLKEDIYKTQVTVDENEGALLLHIDNEGTAIGYDGPGITYSITGGRKELTNYPEGYKYVNGEDISNDGSIMVGSLVGTGFITYAAISINGGEWTMLPQPPAELEPYIGKGSSAKHVSGDGKYILGFTGSFRCGILWVRNDAGEYEIDPLYSKFVVINDDDFLAGEKRLFGLFTMDLSDNGKYAAFRGTIYENGEYLNVPVIYNTETGEMTIYDEPQEIDDILNVGITPTAIADDGTFIGVIGTPVSGAAGSFIMLPGQTQAISFNQAFPSFAEKLGECDDYGFNTPTSLSADGRYVLGYGYYTEDYQDLDVPVYYVTYVIDREVENASAPEIVVTPEEGEVRIYSIDGTQLTAPAKGINLIRQGDGTVRKVLR